MNTRIEKENSRKREQARGVLDLKVDGVVVELDLRLRRLDEEHDLT